MIKSSIEVMKNVQSAQQLHHTQIRYEHLII